jgi:hypothetical protein
MSSRWRVALSVLLLASGCMGSLNRITGSGISKTETRPVEAFHGVRLDGSADISTCHARPDLVKSLT